MIRESALQSLEASRARLAHAVSMSPGTKRLLSFGLSAAILAYLMRAVANIGWQEVLNVLPANPIFYLLVAMSYMATPVTEYIIFRRWWPLTPRALAVFSKKRVLNEAVFGYSGDAYLFMWAKKALGAREVGAGPLAAVKDVAITSALAGNVATLLMLGLALSMGGGEAVQAAFTGGAMRSVGFGFAFVISISLAILLFSRKVMSLPLRENFVIFLLHCGRLLIGSALLLLAWIVALPSVDVGTWVVLGALRMVVTRLPFVPNKELLFAAIGVSLTGSAAPEVAALMAAAGALHLVSHVISYVGASTIESRGDTVAEEGLPQAAGSL
ncbi:hypothetical protein FJQ54_04760 [Sandaracinobacter neustonicus]|uniref:Uncharacterized protein n=1 Tax=Sandaracinobacter neustonicus TaxID=1715348 RepID=A0A501XQK4_9SPHN|nr:hypothetical protein [Sandaracinobacter neustonicus]TPE62836.1 hypothetical protein FJQ54_04760 [Sandaracinobacter neustonicus]